MAIPEVGFLRLHQIVGNPKAIPPVPPLIPVSKSTWWNGVRSGRFPRPIKLGPRTTVWRVEDIQKLINNAAKYHIAMCDLNTWRRLVRSESGPTSPTTRLLLLALSLYMDRDGGSCFPSTMTLSEATALSRRTVMEHIQKAESLEWIKIMRPVVNGQGWKRVPYQASMPPSVVIDYYHLHNERGNPSAHPQPERGDPHAQGGNPGAHNVVTEGDLNYTFEHINNKLQPTFLLKNGLEFVIGDDLLLELSRAYPDVDIYKECRAIRAWCATNPGKRKTHRGAPAFVNRWILAGCAGVIKTCFDPFWKRMAGCA